MVARRVLATGYAATSQASVYAVGSRPSVRITGISLHNEHATTQTVDVYVYDHQGDTHKIRRAVLAQHESYQVCDDGTVINMQANHGIELVTTTASALVYVITGEVDTAGGG